MENKNDENTTFDSATLEALKLAIGNVEKQLYFFELQNKMYGELKEKYDILLKKFEELHEKYYNLLNNLESKDE